MLSTPSPAKWGFHNPVSIRLGSGCVTDTLRTLKFRRVLLVTTPGMVRRGVVAQLVGDLAGVDVIVSDQALPNPQLAALDELAGSLRAEPSFDTILALGGGSAVDTGKILSILMGSPADFSLKNHFQNGLTIPVETVPIPVITIPTTSGTGSEVTPFATVWDGQARKKYSLASPLMFPRWALLDPVLTKNLPWEITLYTGMDALCQAMESIWNRNANPITLEYGYRAAALAWSVLKQGEAILTSLRLRSQLMEASLLAGLAISHTRTALCHSMSYPITAHYGVPHGFACGFTIPAVLRYNLLADDGRLARLAVELGYEDAASLASAVEALLKRLDVPSYLRAHVANPSGIAGMASEMITKGRSDNNLRSVTVEGITEMLNGYVERFLQS